jgi:hypothetical protein
LTNNIIKEIAEQLDCGFRAFIHKTSGEAVFIPDEINYPDIEMEAWESEIELLKENYSDYHEIEKWTSNESFLIMADFAKQLTENSEFQHRLINALNNRKPFRNFKFIIENSWEYREQWFAFRNEKQQEYVEKKLNELESSKWDNNK